MLYREGDTKQSLDGHKSPTPEIKRGKVVYGAYRKLLLKRKSNNTSIILLSIREGWVWRSKVAPCLAITPERPGTTQPRPTWPQMALQKSFLLPTPKTLFAALLSLLGATPQLITIPSLGIRNISKPVLVNLTILSSLKIGSYHYLRRVNFSNLHANAFRCLILGAGNSNGCSFRD